MGTSLAGIVAAYAALLLAVCVIGFCVATVCQAAEQWQDRREAKRRANGGTLR